jgi:hypothetical protein
MIAPLKSGAAGRPIMNPLKLALLCSLGITAGQALACYTVYDRGNSIVYNAQTPPVDMSLPLHQTLPQRFPGGHLVFGAGTDCPLVQPQTLVLVRNSPGTSPLLTMGGPPAARPAGARGTVITELRNPPLTIVQDGNGKVITQLR